MFMFFVGGIGLGCALLMSGANPIAAVLTAFLSGVAIVCGHIWRRLGRDGVDQ